MAGLLYAGFDLARVGSMSVAVTDSHVTGAVASVSATKYCDIDLSTVMSGSYTAFAPAAQTALTTASPLASYTCAFTSSGPFFTINNGGSAFTLDFQTATVGAGGPRLAAALGFTSAHSSAIAGSGYSVKLQSAGTSLNSNVMPYYVVPLARTSPAKYSRPYEPTGFVHRQVTNRGNALAVAPLSLPTLIDLQLPFMLLANVFADDAAAAQPWTIQHLVQHARAKEPVAFAFSAGTWVCKLSDNDAAFARDLRSVAFQAGDYHGLWHVNFTGAQRLGVI